MDWRKVPASLAGPRGVAAAMVVVGHKEAHLMTKLFTITAVLATALAGVAATAGLALAEENGKLYPAFGCVETGTGGGSTINRNEVRITKSSGAASETATVLCPIIRDERASFGSIGSAIVHAYDTIFDKNLSCTLNARSYQHGPIRFETKATSGVNSNGENLVFDGFFVDDVEGGNDAHYYLQCQIPTNVGTQVVKFFSYEVTEF
jgi:hypothetical protein